MTGAPASALIPITDAPAAESLGETLNAATARLARAGIESARLDARLLAAHALGWEKAKIVAEKDFVPAGEQRRTRDALIVRREAREPVAVITGRCEFWSLDFTVNADVLIPRPDSETIIEAALAALADEKRVFILSGTGELIEPDDGIATIGSGGPMALAAARAQARWLPGHSPSPTSIPSASGSCSSASSTPSASPCRISTSTSARIGATR